MQITAERMVTGIIRAVKEKRFKSTRYFEIGVQIDGSDDILHFNISPSGVSHFMIESKVTMIGDLVGMQTVLKQSGKNPVQMEANHGE